jgi:hypothetical protein
VRGALLNSFHLFSSLSTLRERVRVRGIVKTFSSSFFPLHPAGEGKGEGALLKSFHLPSSLSTLRERVRVRGIFFQFFSPLAGENKTERCR